MSLMEYIAAIGGALFVIGIVAYLIGGKSCEYLWFSFSLVGVCVMLTPLFYAMSNMAEWVISKIFE